MDIHAFDVKKLEEFLDEDMEAIHKANKVEVIIRALLPHYESGYIEKAYHEGKLKSHERKEAVSLIQDRIIHSVQSKVKNYNFIFELYDFSKYKILVNYAVKSTFYQEKKRLICETSITIYTPSNFNQRQLKGIIEIFITDIMNLAEKLNVSVYDQSEKRKKPIFKMNLSKKTKTSLFNFLTIEDREDLVQYYSHPVIQQFILNYFYPHPGGDSTRIYLDKLQKDAPVKKSLRIKTPENEWKKIVEILSPEISNENFTEIIKRNDIAGFYSGTVTENDDLCYLVFDIDVSDFFRSLFSAQTIWDLLREVVYTLIDTMIELGIEGYPTVKFSGSRGLHIIYRYQKSTLMDKYRGINLKNLFYQWPGLWELIKNKSSPIKSKTSFSKLFADSIIIYMLFKREIIIPEKIREVLGERIHQKDIFKISIFSSNEAAILIDTSPNSRGVFRTAFSVHPSSKKASIPVFDTESGKFYKKYETYKNVEEHSEISYILESIDQKLLGDLLEYSHIQNAGTVKKHDLDRLLKPNPFLPAVAFYLRFGRRFATERSLGSYFFWYNHFELKLYYEYIEHSVLRESHKEDAKAIFEELKHIVRESYLYRKDAIIRYAKAYLIDKEISYPLYKDRIQGLYYFEFYNRVKTNTLKVINPEHAVELLKDEAELRGFLQKFKHLTLIITEMISTNLKRKEEFKRHEIEAITTFRVRINFAFEYIKRLKDLKKFKDQKEKLLLNWNYLILLYNLGIMFYEKFKRFDEIRVKRKKRKND